MKQNSRTMKNSMKVWIKNPLFLVALAMMTGCGGEGSSGAKVTEIDSVEDREIILETDIENSSMDFNPGTSVKVDLAENADFHWEDFRNQLQAAPESIGEGFHMGDTEVTTAWKPFNDNYSYQTRYHYKNNELWLQTYFRENPGKSVTDQPSNGEGKLLTKNMTQPALQELWKEMENLAGELKSNIKER